MKPEPLPPAPLSCGLPRAAGGSAASGAATRAVIGRRLAVFSGVFVLAVAILMAVNAYLLRTVDPLESPALQTLTTQLESEPANAELRQQVRELDWLARRAFFVKQWQLETGAFLLVIGGIVFILALQLAAADHPRVPAALRPGARREDPWKSAAFARRALAAAGIATLLAAWGLHFRAPRRLPAPPPSAPTAANPTPSAPATATSAASTVSISRPKATVPGVWPSFRGPDGLGIAIGADPPTTWDGATGSNVLWKTAVPLGGYNSPVVWGDRVFLSGADASRREIYCFHADTGALLWTADASDVPGTPTTPPAVTDDTGYAAPSLAVDGERVVALFGTGDLVGVDFDGRRLWARNLGVPANHYGHSSSPLLLGDGVFLQYDHAEGSALLALDVETGETRWQTVRQAQTSWASPILAEAGGQPLLVLAAAPMVAAYDPATGAKRWSRDLLSGEIGSSPAYAAGRVFAANQYARAVALDAATGETLWSLDDLELPDAASPVATAEHVFMPTSHGPFTCLAAADGAVVWEHEVDVGGYGSPIMAAGRIYWVASDGRTRIFNAAGAFTLIAEPALGEPSVCTPAVSGRRLYLRSTRHLFCIEAPAPDGP